jgi:cytochrome c oxidase subunit III
MIPYTVTRRADTGVTNVTLGVWLFLASEVMLFGALFSSYALLRVAAASWPSGREVLNVTIGLTNTAVLLLMTAAIWRARRTSGAAARPMLWTSAAGAVVFLALKGMEYRGEIAAGLFPSTSTFLAMYFTLTGLHALHVVGGMIGNLWAIAGARHVDAALTDGRVRALGLYWTFVDIVWIVILGLMYLS